LHANTTPSTNCTYVLPDDIGTSKRNFKIAPPELGTTELSKDINGKIPNKMIFPVSGK
jgi:hypothetical protein